MAGAPPLPREEILRRLAAIDRAAGNLSVAARGLKLSRGTLQHTLTIADRLGLNTPPRISSTQLYAHYQPPEAPGRLDVTLRDGIAIVGSDAHYWPGVVSTAHRAFIHMCRELKPKLVVMNGDMLDGASISRHPPIGWEHRPSLAQEIEAVQDRLGEITIASEGARRIWPLGNHDARLETKIATVAPEFARIHGVHLSDHFPDWEKCWSVFINGKVVVKHRARGGIHATHNNVVNSGLTMVTGHLHSLKVTPFSDYRDAARWGVDCGTMASPWGEQFGYMEDTFRNWRSGFAVLTFRDGELMWPEVVFVRDDERGVAEFRGNLIPGLQPDSAKGI